MDKVKSMAQKETVPVFVVLENIDVLWYYTGEFHQSLVTV